MTAAVAGHAGICSLLVGFGADPHRQDAFGSTAAQLCGGLRMKRWFMLQRVHALKPIFVLRLMRSIRRHPFYWHLRNVAWSFRKGGEMHVKLSFLRLRMIKRLKQLKLCLKRNMLGR